MIQAPDNPKPGDLAYEFDAKTQRWKVFRAEGIWSEPYQGNLWFPPVPRQLTGIRWRSEHVLLTADGRVLQVEEKCGALD